MTSGDSERCHRHSSPCAENMDLMRGFAREVILQRFGQHGIIVNDEDLPGLVQVHYN